MKTKFLNVDLEMISASRPVALERELIDLGALNLFSGDTGDGYLSTFEVNPDRGTPEDAITAFHEFFGQLSSKAKKEWNEASERAFDIGFESTDPIELSFEESSQRMIEDMEGIVRFTTYEVS